MNGIEINWRDMSEFPTPGNTVLIHVPGDDEPVWFGFWDGRRWHYIEGLPVRAEVRHWSRVPAPPLEIVPRKDLPLVQPEPVPRVPVPDLLATVA